MTAELGENASDMPTDRCCTAFWVRYSMTEWKINRDMGLLCSVYGYILYGRGRSEFGVDILELELWSQKKSTDSASLACDSYSVPTCGDITSAR